MRKAALGPVLAGLLGMAHPGALDWSDTIGLADAAALRQHPPAAQWLASGQLTTLPS